MDLFTWTWARCGSSSKDGRLQGEPQSIVLLFPCLVLRVRHVGCCCLHVYVEVGG